MRRRKFIALAGGAAAIWPFIARAQQHALPVVAFVNGGEAAAATGFGGAFRKGLSETGFTEGQNVLVEYHWLDGHYDSLPTLLADIVRRQVAVIATPGATNVALAAKAATSTIPIVFGVAEDPVKLGLVASLARPGGNATGANFFAFEVVSKQLALLHELVPKATHIGVLVNPTNASGAEIVLRTVRDVGATQGLEIQILEASTPEEIDAAFAALAAAHVDALFVAADGFFASRRVQIATLAARDRMPASYFSREMVEAGLLMSYGTSIPDMFRQVGIYTGTILKGGKPADLPVLQSTKFEFVINQQTARALGIDIPPALLSIADDVIE
jgi:putative tryptophan/tyrosine transport system substrate-binding protein